MDVLREWVSPPLFIYFLLSPPSVPDLPLSPEAEHALLSLEHKLQGPPQFTQGLEDQTVAQGSSARLSCHLTGTQNFIQELKQYLFLFVCFLLQSSDLRLDLILKCAAELKDLRLDLNFPQKT